MHQAMWRCAAVAAAAGLVLWAGAARAQDYETVHPYILVNPEGRHPVLRLMHIQPPLFAWTSHNNLGCGSLESELVFGFGSCRMFFGDPHLKAPPPLPWADHPPQPPVDNRGPLVKIFGLRKAPTGEDGSGGDCNCGW